MRIDGMKVRPIPYKTPTPVSRSNTEPRIQPHNPSMKKLILLIPMLALFQQVFCWGFFAHQKINYYAVFLLPPQMMVLYKPNIDFITEHAIDPDKRRYAVKEEGPRHYIDIDYYGKYPYSDLPRNYKDAVAKFGEDSLISNGIVPWHVQVMLNRL